jgi:hypothetical protein
VPQLLTDVLAGLGGSYEEFIWSVINREER